MKKRWLHGAVVLVSCIALLFLIRASTQAAADVSDRAIRGHPYATFDAEGLPVLALSRVRQTDRWLLPIGVRDLLAIRNVSRDAAEGECTVQERASAAYVDYLRDLEANGSITATEVQSLRLGEIREYRMIWSGVAAHVCLVVVFGMLLVMVFAGGRTPVGTP